MTVSYENIIEKIKEQMNIVDLIEEYLYLKKSGSNYIGLCPFHSEKTPSFTVSDEKQIYHCFGCGAGGDGITFIMQRENLDFKDAVKFLADKYNIPWEEGVDLKDEEEKNDIYNINKEAAKFFLNELAENNVAKEYLKNRNISSTISKTFGLGFAPDSWDKLINHLRKSGFETDLMYRAGLVSKNKDTERFFDKFRNRIIFPIIDTKSRVIGFGGRVLDRSLPKYLNSPDTPVFNKGFYLYGLNIISKNKDRKRIILVEGYMDVISLFTKGINSSVASLGTALTRPQSKLLKRYGKEIYICYDGDSAGRRATLKAIDILLEEEVEPRIILLQDDMDPDDFINQRGLPAFEKAIEESLHYFDFKVHLLREKYDISEPTQKIKFVREVANILKRLNSKVEQDIYAEKISKDTGVSKEAIYQEIGTNNRPKYRIRQTEKIEPIIDLLPKAYIKAEMDIIGFTLINKDYFEKISEFIHVDDFIDSECKYCYLLISDFYSIKDKIEKSELLEELKDDDKSLERFKEIVNHIPHFEPENEDKVINDIIKTIKKSELLRKRSNLLIQIQGIEKKENDLDNFHRLIKELTELNKQITTTD
ncbi:MAG: DNA primase [Gudongella sp.]|nr:DNA primase [Gudongella sp.]